VRHTDYARIAADYDRRYVEEDYSGIEDALFEFIGPVGRRVVEAGCGTGHWIELLRGRGISAIGIDPARPMLMVARSRLLSTMLMQGRAEALPLASASVDRLFTINAHHHFEDKHSFLREAHRVLRSGGSLMTIALDPHAGIDRWWVYDYFPETLEIDKERYPACTQLCESMQQIGFTAVHTREVMHVPGDITAERALERDIVSPSHTSQLAVLTRDEYEAGVDRIRAALAANPALRLYSDLRVHATFATGRSFCFSCDARQGRTPNRVCCDVPHSDLRAGNDIGELYQRTIDADVLHIRMPRRRCD
jgi:ubiquinone/menaquinone biosynthesis C-methylase UbiE